MQLTRLLHAGPLRWEEPLFLLVAYALQHPQRVRRLVLRVVSDERAEFGGRELGPRRLALELGPVLAAFGGGGGSSRFTCSCDSFS